MIQICVLNVFFTSYHCTISITKNGNYFDNSCDQKVKARIVILIADIVAYRADATILEILNGAQPARRTDGYCPMPIKMG